VLLDSLIELLFETRFKNFAAPANNTADAIMSKTTVNERFKSIVVQEK
jgi:hypothetical protein